MHMDEYMHPEVVVPLLRPYKAIAGQGAGIEPEREETLEHVMGSHEELELDVLGPDELTPRAKFNFLGPNELTPKADRSACIRTDSRIECGNLERAAQYDSP